MANSSRQQYIDQYAEYAMEQMRRYGIPASVTLAQGIIESANGKSTLARTANNHFGVKGEFNGAYVLETRRVEPGEEAPFSMGWGDRKASPGVLRLYAGRTLSPESGPLQVAAPP